MEWILIEAKRDVVQSRVTDEGGLTPAGRMDGTVIFSVVVREWVDVLVRR
jgi:hypothetical protein